VRAEGLPIHIRNGSLRQPISDLRNPLWVPSIGEPNNEGHETHSDRAGHGGRALQCIGACKPGSPQAGRQGLSRAAGYTTGQIRFCAASRSNGRVRGRLSVERQERLRGGRRLRQTNLSKIIGSINNALEQVTMATGLYVTRARRSAAILQKPYCEA
jgi:hypothetical protein